MLGTYSEPRIQSKSPAVVAADGTSDVGAGTNCRGRLPDRPELPLRIALPAFPLNRVAVTINTVAAHRTTEPTQPGGRARSAPTKV
jgi:hypothetical protein